MDDEIDVSERDATALRIARKLLLYQAALRESPQLSDIAEILFRRIDCLRYGGRSYSLYSLMILARAGSLSVPDAKLEADLKVLHTVTNEDSFLHQEYAVILMGDLLARYRAQIHPETTEVCVRRMTQLSKQTERKLLAETASRVICALDAGSNALDFELVELLPEAYSEEVADDGDLSSPEARARAKRLQSTVDPPWTQSDKEFMYRYIRFTEARKR